MSKPQPEPRQSLGRRCLWMLTLLLPLTVATLLLAERWRGRNALGRWKSQMTTRGEAFDVKALWPPASPLGAQFSEKLKQAVEQLPTLPSGFGQYASSLSGIVQVEPGKCRRGSQEPQPLVSKT